MKINHRNNSTFQLKYFIAGRCATPDGAWAQLYSQKNDMERKLGAGKASVFRQKASKIKIERALETYSKSEPEYWEALADKEEADSNLDTFEKNLEAAEKEYHDICSLIDEIEPQCKLSHLPLHERLEASQQEEWLGELKRRAENFILCTGSIPPDEFDTMRSHPDFEEKILPHIQTISAALPQIHNGSFLANPKATRAIENITKPGRVLENTKR